MAYKVEPPSMVSTASKLAYCLRSIHEAASLNSPKTLTEAKLLLSLIEHVAGVAVSETREDYPALVA